MIALRDFKDKKIAVAVSGGADSVALLHYLRAQADAFGYHLVAVHCEHGIRGEESLADMRFVEGLCARWEIPLYTFSADCPARAKREKCSLETAARVFRRECFTRLISEGKAAFIATAHHQNDEAETVLFRLARGASLTGMSAIKQREGVYLRPLLDWSKEEILAYCQAHGLEYRTDSTNLQTDATRNKIRLEVLRKLEEAVPAASRNIARFAALAAEDDELLYALSAPLVTKDEEGYAVAFCEKKPLFTRACLSALKGMGVEKDYERAHLQALFGLQSAERGARLTLPQGVRAQKKENGVCFYRYRAEELPENALPQPFRREGFEGGMYAVNVKNHPISEEEKGWKVLRVDGEKIPATAVFRFREEGDYIRRFGGGTKSLKKMFNEEKIPLAARGRLPLIAQADGGEVYVVCGVEISEGVKVDENTREVLYIALEETHG